MNKIPLTHHQWTLGCNTPSAFSIFFVAPWRLVEASAHLKMTWLKRKIVCKNIRTLLNSILIRMLLFASDRSTTLTGLNRRENLLAYVTAKTKKKLGPSVRIGHLKSGAFLLFCSAFLCWCDRWGLKRCRCPRLTFYQMGSPSGKQVLTSWTFSHTHKRRIFFEWIIVCTKFQSLF